MNAYDRAWNTENAARIIRNTDGTYTVERKENGNLVEVIKGLRSIKEAKNKTDEFYKKGLIVRGIKIQ